MDLLVRVVDDGLEATLEPEEELELDEPAVVDEPEVPNPEELLSLSVLSGLVAVVELDVSGASFSAVVVEQATIKGAIATIARLCLKTVDNGMVCP
jgi:hypothetical protein